MAEKDESFVTGQAIFVAAIDSDSKEEVSAEITEVSDNGLFLVISVSDEGFQSTKGDTLRIRSWDEKAVYYSDCQVVKSGNGGSLHISRPASAVTLQRRRKLRSDIEIPFSFTIMAAAQSQLVSDDIHKAKTENLSMNGLRFQTNLPLSEGDEIVVVLPLTPPDKINAGGRVVRAERESGERFLIVSLALRQLSPEEQKSLLKFMEE